MNRAAYTSTATAVVLVAGALLTAALLSSHPVETVTAAHAAMQVTPVPTVGAIASPQAQPPITISRSTLLTSLSVQTESREPQPLPTIPGPLLDPSLSLLAGPRSVPLQIRIPAINIDAPVVGVGLTSANAMAAPIGLSEDDPMWQTAFWYRGGGIPGNVGTATMAGHVTDELGRPGVFGYLADVRPGDLIVIHDMRSDLDVPFIVTETQTYTEDEAAAPDVLARVFGSASLTDPSATLPSDELAHLTLITCSGTWVDGSFSLRFVVYAVRANYPV